MTIYDAVNELIADLRAQYQDLDLMYEDDADIELNSKNQELYERLSQAVKAWNGSVEDQILKSIRENNNIFVDEDAWIEDDEEFEKELEGWYDGDLDEYKGKSL